MVPAGYVAHPTLPYSSGYISSGADERTALGRGHRRMSADLPWTLQPDICSCV